MRQVNTQAHIYAGRIGAVELEARLLLEQGEEKKALDRVTSAEYRDLCTIQATPKNPEHHYRTAEDPRVLALKLRNQVQVIDGEMIGFTLTTFRGALAYVKNHEPGDKMELYSEIVNAYLVFCTATSVSEPDGILALRDLFEQNGLEKELIIVEEQRPKVKLGTS